MSWVDRKRRPHGGSAGQQSRENDESNSDASGWIDRKQRPQASSGLARADNSSENGWVERKKRPQGSSGAVRVDDNAEDSFIDEKQRPRRKRGDGSSESSTAYDSMTPGAHFVNPDGSDGPPPQELAQPQHSDPRHDFADGVMEASGKSDKDDSSTRSPKRDPSLPVIAARLVEEDEKRGSRDEAKSDREQEVAFATAVTGDEKPSLSSLLRDNRIRAAIALVVLILIAVVVSVVVTQRSSSGPIVTTPSPTTTAVPTWASMAPTQLQVCDMNVTIDCWVGTSLDRTDCFELVPCNETLEGACMTPINLAYTFDNVGTVDNSISLFEVTVNGDAEDLVFKLPTTIINSGESFIYVDDSTVLNRKEGYLSVTALGEFEPFQGGSPCMDLDEVEVYFG